MKLYKNINYKIFLNNKGIIDLTLSNKDKTKKILKFLPEKDIYSHILWKKLNLKINSDYKENAINKFNLKYNKVN